MAHTTNSALRRTLRALDADGRLHNRASALAGVIWLAIAALALGLYVAGVRIWLAQPDWFSIIPCPGALCQSDTQAVQRALDPLHLSLGLVGGYVFAMHILVVTGFAVIAALIFWYRRRDPLAFFVSVTLLVFGALFFDPEMGLLTATMPGLWLPISVLRSLGLAAFGVFALTFPNGRFVPRWTLLVAGAWTLWTLPFYIFPGSALDFNTWPAVVSIAVWALLLSAIATAQIYRYRHVSTPAQRQQTKWVVLGIAITAVVYFGRELILVYYKAVPQAPAAEAALGDLIGRTLLYVSLLLIPISIGVAMLRHHLFDVDLLIRWTLVYSALVATLAMLYEGGTLILVKGVLAFTGQESFVLEVALAFGIGTLAAPLHHRIERDISHLLYPRKYEAERRIEEVTKQLRHDWHIVPLSEEVEEVTMQRMARAWAALRHRAIPNNEASEE
ncbi:MAG TPA: hypothetical protein VF510_15360 [Ktedonobacterales bacterium]